VSFIKLPDVPLAEGRHTDLRKNTDGKLGVAYPAALALVPTESGQSADEKLLVPKPFGFGGGAEYATGKVERTFDLSEKRRYRLPIQLHCGDEGRAAGI